jgi:hypothetical protein
MCSLLSGILTNKMKRKHASSNDKCETNADYMAWIGMDNRDTVCGAASFEGNIWLANRFHIEFLDMNRPYEPHFEPVAGVISMEIMPDKPNQCIALQKNGWMNFLRSNHQTSRCVQRLYFGDRMPYKVVTDPNYASFVFLLTTKGIVKYDLVNLCEDSFIPVKREVRTCDILNKRQLIFHDEDKLKIWDSRQSKYALQITHKPLDDVYCFSRKESQLYIGKGTDGIDILDLKANKIRQWSPLPSYGLCVKDNVIVSCDRTCAYSFENVPHTYLKSHFPNCIRVTSIHKNTVVILG